MAALASAGVFRLRGVLIGTIAQQTNAAMLGVRRSAGSRKAGDVDIAQFKMSRWLSTTQCRPFRTCVSDGRCMISYGKPACASTGQGDRPPPKAPLFATFSIR
ncbi:GSU2403 family nucleotidyltransferase fold protein [Bradyrhizobium elkanii]|uniref:GSU2403 family nucleotidyltransferase fold protein n=1 Tax=Bradyrhizobium elkanii TaxID=29448 RepID=UPI003B8A7CA5